MKKYIFKKSTISLILIFIILIMFLVNFSSTTSAYDFNNFVKKPRLLTPKFPSIKRLIENFLQRFFDPNFSPMLKPFNNQTFLKFKHVNKDFKVVFPDNTTKTIDLLDKDFKVIKLYNNRLGIKSLDHNFTLLSENSTVLSEYTINKSLGNIVLIDIPESESVIGVTDPIVEVPLDEMVTNVTHHQSVDSLNEYKISSLFSELNNPDLFENILCYSIDWGDGSSVETYLPSEKEVIHLYKSSGTYLQILYIKDISGEIYSFNNYYTVEYEGHLIHTYFILDEYKEPIVTTSAGISLATIVGYGLTETGKYKLLALLSLLIPMYTHINKDDVLDNFVRGEIYGLIKANPGICYTKIMQKLDVKNGTLSYHLHKLEKMEMIKSRREGLRYRAFYPTGMKFPKEERYRLTDLQIKILNAIKANNGINQRKIAKKLGRNPQTINYNIKVLQQAELIKLNKKGRRTICFAL